jgi:hypothetical protein
MVLGADLLGGEAAAVLVIFVHLAEESDLGGVRAAWAGAQVRGAGGDLR